MYYALSDSQYYNNLEKLTNIRNNGSYNELNITSDQIFNDESTIRQMLKICTKDIDTFAVNENYGNNNWRKYLKLLVLCVNNYTNATNINIFMILANYMHMFPPDSKMRTDKQIALKLVETDTKPRVKCRLSYLSPELQNDNEIIHTALRCNPLALEFAPVRFRENEELVLKLIERDPTVFSFVSVVLKNNENFVSKALNINQNVFSFLNDNFRFNDEIAKKAIQTNPLLLKNASNEIKNNSDIVLNAIKANPKAFIFAGEILQNNKEIANEAITKMPGLLRYSGDEVKNDRNIVITAIKADPYAFMFAGKILQSDREIANEAITKIPNLLSYASIEIQNEAIKNMPN